MEYELQNLNDNEEINFPFLMTEPQNRTSKRLNNYKKYILYSPSKNPTSLYFSSRFLRAPTPEPEQET